MERPARAPVPAGSLMALSRAFLTTFSLLGAVLGTAILLTPGFLDPGGAQVVMGTLIGINLAIAVCMWIRPDFATGREQVLIYLSEINILAGSLVTKDPIGARLGPSLFILTAMFAALFLRMRHTIAVVVSIAGATIFVMWFKGDTWLLAVLHSSTVVMAATGPCFIVALLQARLSQALARSQHQAATDPLTGLTNRRGLAQRLPEIVALAREQGHTLGLLNIDIDHFKAVNDTYGHGVGDEVLQDVAAAISSCVRAEDVVVRLGGEEMAVLATLPPAMLLSLAERIRQAVARDCAVTVSVGVACAPADRASLTNPHAFLRDLAEEADEQLYAAKNAGRNQVCAAAQLLETG